MKTGGGVWIIIPAHRRPRISRVSFAGIRWTIDELKRRGIEARALVVADDENLQIADELGLDALERPNEPLGRKWNDGFEHALSEGAAHLVSCGSDDWIHPDLIHAQTVFSEASLRDTILCSRQSAVISPTGHEAVTITVGYESGDGVRMIPRALLEQLGRRPYDDRRSRALDGSMLDKARRHGARFVYTDLHPWQIVDFKSVENITPYSRFPGCEHEPTVVQNPLAMLAKHYPAHLVELARDLYEGN